MDWIQWPGKTALEIGKYHPADAGRLIGCADNGNRLRREQPLKSGGIRRHSAIHQARVRIRSMVSGVIGQRS